MLLHAEHFWSVINVKFYLMCNFTGWQAHAHLPYFEAMVMATEMLTVKVDLHDHCLRWEYTEILNISGMLNMIAIYEKSRFILLYTMILLFDKQRWWNLIFRDYGFLSKSFISAKWCSNHFFHLALYFKHRATRSTSDYLMVGRWSATKSRKIRKQALQWLSICFLSSNFASYLGYLCSL